jgi:hypothetical protein
VYWCKGEQITMVQTTLLEISTMTGLTVLTDKTDGFQTVGYALRNELLSVYKRRVLFVNNFGLIERKNGKRNVYSFLRDSS